MYKNGYKISSFNSFSPISLIQRAENFIKSKKKEAFWNIYRIPKPALNKSDVLEKNVENKSREWNIFDVFWKILSNILNKINSKNM